MLGPRQVKRIGRVPSPPDDVGGAESGRWSPPRSPLTPGGSSRLSFRTIAVKNVGTERRRASDVNITRRRRSGLHQGEQAFRADGRAGGGGRVDRGTLRGSALAFEFDTGNPDLSIRWDNTIRYNLGLRVEGRDDKIGNSAVSDEGTYSFDSGSVVTNRIDILSELDFVYKKQMGFRVSGAGWYDGAYDDRARSNPNPPLVNIPSYVNQQYTPYTKRYYRGPSGELLDAFVFGNFDVGTVPTSLKAGRHSLYWGESLFLGGNLHSIAYAQNPLDLQKGFATPGIEAKELFRPLRQVSGQAQITDTVSVAAQYFFEWEEFRFPEGGTYLGPVDFASMAPSASSSPRASASPRSGDPSSPVRAASGASPPAGAPSGSTARSASTTATTQTSCRRRFLTRAAPATERV